MESRAEVIIIRWKFVLNEVVDICVKISASIEDASFDDLDNPVTTVHDTGNDFVG
jgi:hypothetical protein